MIFHWKIHQDILYNILEQTVLAECYGVVSSLCQYHRYLATVYVHKFKKPRVGNSAFFEVIIPPGC